MQTRTTISPHRSPYFISKGGGDGDGDPDFDQHYPENNAYARFWSI
jgi:hypothetical protein